MWDITNENILNGAAYEAEEFSDGIVNNILNCIYKFEAGNPIKRVYLIAVLTGILLILIGMYISIYANISDNSRRRRFMHISSYKYTKYLELLTNKFPLRIISAKLNSSISYFMLNENVQRSIVAISTIALPAAGILLFSSLRIALNLWYTRLITLVLCIMVPYYIFTLIVDYMKYNLRLKIPIFIDSFRSSFITHYRIKPALQECSRNADKSLGRIMLRVSDSRDINESLSEIRDRINDTWFNIFVLLLVNYRENGGELVAQLYKLNRTITRYNNIEKKKNKRLIWYEFFTIMTSLFSIPLILMINKTILGINPGQYYDVTSSFSKIVIFSLLALIIVRILRRM